jgi:hypothetical protein
MQTDPTQTDPTHTDPTQTERKTAVPVEPAVPIEPDRPLAPGHPLTRVLGDTLLAHTADAIVAQQQRDGLILWFEGGHADVWNHTEAAMALAVAGRRREAERAYEWLLDAQHRDGWWHHYYLRDGVEDAKVDTNCCAYVATGIYHHWLLTRDRGFVETMWPVVERAIEFVLSLQAADGTIAWARHTDGTPWSYALLTGSSSIFHSVGCAVQLAEVLGDSRPAWELAAVRLRDVIAERPESFEPKHRWAMDWYYPVLTGAIGGTEAQQRLARAWPTFVMPGAGVRCVSDRDWVTAAETCECAMALLNVEEERLARELFDWVQHLRGADGAYYTGIAYPDEVHFPADEKTTYTGAAVILAADALDRRTPAAELFTGGVLPHLA